MQLQLGYRYRLEPDDAGRERLAQVAGCCRWLWNRELGNRNEVWEIVRSVGGKVDWKEMGYLGAARDLTRLRHQIDWMGDCPVHPLQQTLRDLDRAFADFFKGGKGHPRFRAKGDDSFRFPDSKQFRIDEANCRVFLPKLGYIKFRRSRPLPEGAIPKNITVIREGGHWFVSFSIVFEEAEPEAPAGEPVALDFGIAEDLRDNNGTTHSLGAPSPHEDRLVKRVCRQLSRKKKGSKRRAKAKARLGNLKRRQKRRRLDAAHKLSTRLAKNHRLVAVEDIRLANMTASARGTLANPGSHVAAKAGLNRKILARGFGQFRVLLGYKCRRYGSQMVVVPAAFTSQRCSRCGHTHPQNRPDRDTFLCSHCGHSDHADTNAAINILAAGLAAAARGGIGLKPPVETRTIPKGHPALAA